MLAGNSPNRVVLTQSCFCSPIGNSRPEALHRLRSGLSGIRSLDGFFPNLGGAPFLFTGAVSFPGDDAPEARDWHPRLSERYGRILEVFCRQVREMRGEHSLDKLLLICRVPFYSDWKLPSGEGEDFNDYTFVSRFLERSRLSDLDERKICFLQATCSTGVLAVNLAVRELCRQPYQKALLVGIEAELHHERFLALKKLGALSPEQDPRRSCQPFSKARTGLVAGEVAVAALLESKPAEEVREGDIEVIPGCCNSDAYRFTDGLESGQYLQACLEQTLGPLGVDHLDFLCPHGTSTPLNDQLEGEVLERFLSGRSEPLPIVPLKQYVGHALNSSGLWETVLCAELLRHDFLPPILNPDELESYQKLRFERDYRQTPLRRALKLSIGFGGINAALILEKAG